jgi:hypothetical protein
MQAVEFWAKVHSDAFHPGGRENCEHCQEMIRAHGPMPPVEDIGREIDRQQSALRNLESQKAPIPAALRWEVWERDDFRCQECGARRFLSVDHILAESKGGTLAIENLRTLCVTCNCRKGAR